MSYRRAFTIVTAVVLGLTALAPGANSAPPDPRNDVAWVLAEEDAGAVRAYVEQHPQDFSGFWLDRARNRFVVAVPEGLDAAPRTGALRRLAPVRAASAFTAPVEVQRRPTSLAVLNDALAEVGEELTAATSPVNSWYVDEQLGKVVVEVGEDVAGATASVTESVTASVTGVVDADLVSVVTVKGRNTTHKAVVPVREPVKAVKVTKSRVDELNAMAYPGPDREYDHLPFYTGNRIIRWDEGQVSWCSSASVNYARTHMYTAGHCFVVGQEILQGYFDQAANLIYYSDEIGSVVSSQWGNNRIDAQSLSTTKYANRQYHGGVTTQNYLTQFKNTSAYTGMRVCGNGSVSGTRCAGELVRTNVCVTYADDGVTPCGMSVVQSLTTTPLSQSGDSGGPVILDSTGTGAQVVGIISGGNDTQRTLFYSPIAAACAQVSPFTCD
ncbi:alpha-lytic protease prodomain-containing protein [Saccharothrix carnea]|uniref:Alpha-lytic protease prodomain-containing protein n=1 Tax=Saccharothrix carnea TaxID=1280637 RepID=A0A2P8IHF6_SACCR|nr:alpha-lytic protease prodomain-containing protein [Saccharothrix carnea]PSL57910.1 alpha-lytic protease prodomain-containing protein [Saccharothrix carnea]